MSVLGKPAVLSAYLASLTRVETVCVNVQLDTTQTRPLILAIQPANGSGLFNSCQKPHGKERKRKGRVFI